MTPYRTSTKIKLGLIVAAVAIGLSSLLFTQRLADRLEAQDEQAVELWARAIEFQYRVSAGRRRARGRGLGRPGPGHGRLGAAGPERAPSCWRPSTRCATGRPSDGLDFVFSQIVEPDRFSIPAVITDSAMTTALIARNVGRGPPTCWRWPPRWTGSTRRSGSRASGGQLVHYGESPLARMIRLFPYVQLAVVALFVLVGYLGFSYVRRSEQSNLWVGMAKEAAHQLGTPLSSMIGWVELLRLGDAVDPEQVADELERDVDRLRRVADRFEKIGSRPTLTPQPVRPVLDGVADYIRRRVPTSGPPVVIEVDAAGGPGGAAQRGPVRVGRREPAQERARRDGGRRRARTGSTWSGAGSVARWSC